MRRLVAGELRKLSTTKTIYLLLASVIAVAVMSVIDPDHTAATFDKPFHEQTFVLFTSLLSRILLLVLGIRVITDEFRHGTIVPTLLVAPRRGRVLAAKAVAVGVAGAVLGAIAWGVVTGTASIIARSDGATLSIGSGVWRCLAGMTAAGAAWAFIGLGLGSVIRSQIVATVAGLLWLMGLEDAIRGWFGDLASYLPGQAGLALAIAPAPRALWIGGRTMLIYVIVAMAVSSWAMRRDVT